MCPPTLPNYAGSLGTRERSSGAAKLLPTVGTEHELGCKSKCLFISPITLSLEQSNAGSTGASYFSQQPNSHTVIFDIDL